MAMVPLMNAVTDLETGDWTTPRKHFGKGVFVTRDQLPPSVLYQGNMAFLADIVGDGAISATIIIEATNGGVGTVTLGTITLSGSDLVSDGFSVVNSPWEQVRARITALSASTTCNVRMSV